MSELRNGAFDSTMSFELKTNPVAAIGTQEVNEQPAVDARTIKGAYVIVDNGYLNWSTTVPPLSILVIVQRFGSLNG
jgi:hypothetical protein